MKEKNFSDDEIEVLGNNTRKRKTKQFILFTITTLAIIVALLFVFLLKQSTQHAITENFTQIEIENLQQIEVKQGYVKIEHDTINDVPLLIFIPHNALPELSLTLPSETDSSVIFVTQAADFGANNYGIVGDFVILGEQLARGNSKKGFCAIINNMLTIGTGTETPLLEKAKQEKGYFFRQYPLVENGEAITNKPKGKAIRRALAIRENEVIMVESCHRESFHDFAQALADMEISDAIYLVGGNSILGWYRTCDNQVQPLGSSVGEQEQMQGVNYLVWQGR